MNKDDLQHEVLNDVKRERMRQDAIHPQELSISDRFVVLGEEVGEVARAIQNNDPDNLYDELIQVAAESVRMAEQILASKRSR
jgi:NTP pyrophosphatase (non-canonical NTP hydrolase)